MKTVFYRIFAFCVLLSVMPLHAENYFFNETNLFTDNESVEFEKKAFEISSAYDCGVYVIFVNDMKEYGFNDITQFDVWLADEYNFGIGPDRNYITFTVSMRDRDYSVNVNGDIGNSAFCTYGREKLVTRFLGYMGDDNYASAVKKFLSSTDEYLAQYAQGTPYGDGHMVPEDINALIFWSIVLVIVAALIALIMCKIEKSKLNNIAPATNAQGYFTSSDVKFSVSEENFVRKTTRVEVIESSSSSGGSSHSSGSHTSGKF